MVQPSLEDYLELAREKKGGIIPVYQRWLADTETPVSLYCKLAQGKYSFLLESVEGGERVARYSFLGFSPFLLFRHLGEKTVIEGDGRLSVHSGSPFDLLRQVLREYQGRGDEELPRFYGGAVGYFGYDTVEHLEKIRREKGRAVDGKSTPEGGAVLAEIPDAFFMFTEVVVIVDHVRREGTVVVNTRPGVDPARTYAEAKVQIAQVLERIRVPRPEEASCSPAASGQQAGDGQLPPGRAGAIASAEREETFVPAPTRPEEEGVFTPEISRAEFEEMVRQAKGYIEAGDIFQVVLSHRFTARYSGQPFWLYRRLRQINPSPYMFYLDFGDLQLIGASPEMLVRVEGRPTPEGGGKGQLVQVRPIAGTRPRGRTEEEDRRLGEELLADEKERAEHVMLVDLARNDLGRVAQFGTVEVSEFMTLERYSHVTHIVSEVRGQLRPELEAMDALQACFPAGTVSGAPKVRAMEIIAELEKGRRGPYAGAVGYFGFNGQMDTCIAIRTLVLTRERLYLQAGAGIVADSVPAREYDETLNKARALFKVLAAGS